MSLLTPPSVQYVDLAGKPLAFAKLYLYLTGTTTPVEAFRDAEMLDPLPTPVVADAQGIFPAIYFDGQSLVRAKLVSQTGDLSTPVLDVDPVNQLFTVYAGNIADGAIEEKLGYTPVDPANALFTAPARLDFTPTELNFDDVGYRGNPVAVKNLDYTFTVEDSQRLIRKDDTGEYDWTIPKSTFPLGHYIELNVGNTGDVVLKGATGVTLLGANSLTAGPRTLTDGFRGRVQQVAADVWVLSPDVVASAGDLSANGYYKLPNGYIRQWGTYSGVKSGDTTQTVNFPIPFPNGCYGAVATAIQGGSPNPSADMSVSISAKSNTQLTVYVSGNSAYSIDGFDWEAWGH